MTIKYNHLLSLLRYSFFFRNSDISCSKSLKMFSHTLVIKNCVMYNNLY